MIPSTGFPKMFSKSKPNRKLAIINSEEFTVDSTAFLVIKSIAEQFDGTVCLAG